MDANWERSKDIAPSIYAMPTGFITGSLDPVNQMMPGAAEAMAEALPDFRGSTVVDGAGHWVQQERPAETNAALLAFLALGVSALAALPAQPKRRALAHRDLARGDGAGGRRPDAAARPGLRPRRPARHHLRRGGGPGRPADRGALRRCARALRPAADPGHGGHAAAQLVDGQVGAARRGGPAGRRSAGSTSMRRPRCPSGPSPTIPAAPSPCASSWPCATGWTGSRTTSTTGCPTSSQMLFGVGQEDMAHFAADRPLAAEPGTRFNYSSGTSNIISGIVARLVGPGEDYARFLHSRLFAPIGMTSADPEFDAAGTWVASSYSAGHGARLGPLRTALPARRPLGGRPGPPRGLGRRRADDGLGRPRGRLALRVPLVGRGRRHAWARSAPRATRGSRSSSARRSTSSWCAWARPRSSARRTWSPGGSPWWRPSPGPAERVRPGSDRSRPSGARRRSPRRPARWRS